MIFRFLKWTPTQLLNFQVQQQPSLIPMKLLIQRLLEQKQQRLRQLHPKKNLQKHSNQNTPRLLEKKKEIVEALLLGNPKSDGASSDHSDKSTKKESIKKESTKKGSTKKESTIQHDENKKDAISNKDMISQESSNATSDTQKRNVKKPRITCGIRLLICSLIPILWVSLPFLLQVISSADISEIAGQHVIICGASTGIGEQLAYQYARLGAHIVVNSRSKEPLERVADKCREKGAASVSVVEGDLSTYKGCRSVLERALKSLEGQVDVLVLNHVFGFFDWWLSDTLTNDNDEDVGNESAQSLIGHPNSDIEGAFKIIPKMFAVNTMSYIYLATMATNVLSKSKGGGRLMVVSSVAGKMGLPKVSPYSATKHALHGFFDSLRLEYKHKLIPVSITTCVLGRIDTASSAKANMSPYAPPGASASATALIMIRGTHDRRREIYYPPWQGIKFMQTLRFFAPGMTDWILLQIV